MTVEEMKKRKQALGYSYERISRLSGVPLGTVQKIFCGVTKTPRYATLRALEKIFVEDDRILAGRENPASCARGGGRASVDGILRDASASYAYDPMSREPVFPQPSPGKKQGQYTVKDYFALPDEGRVELINGVFYDMASPTGTHQSISMYISNVFFNYIQSNKGTCRVYTAPLDVQLNRDDRTVVQPDILVVCGKDRYRNGIIYGAPELVIEILSDSTRGKDLFLKLNLYCGAGVREYWTVDPKRQEITVFQYADEIRSTVYDRHASVPVGIWDDKCAVDAAELFEYAGYEEEQEDT